MAYSIGYVVDNAFAATAHARDLGLCVWTNFPHIFAISDGDWSIYIATYVYTIKMNQVIRQNNVRP